MSPNEPIHSRLEDGLKNRLSELSDLDDRKDFAKDALAFDKRIVYTLELSWGGPADGFKFYVDPSSNKIVDIKYYYSEWFDFHERSLNDDEFEQFLPVVLDFADKV